MEVKKAVSTCPDCGFVLCEEPWTGGLCPQCLLELALEDSSVEARLGVDPQDAPTLQFTAGGFAEGEVQGERYRIRSLLGRGGMGEVWRAYDLKLRQDVALKALRKELIEDSQALEVLRQEVRAAREVISPNVCRVFDLQEIGGRELVSMEYIDGVTLQTILEERSPLQLEEAREIASQFLAGLEAIHAAGLVHRDIKPENVMLTRTGRVVVMDFGIAKGLGDGKSGVIAGTPAYMSPEQSKGGELDARADVFAAGVVLAEMVAPGGVGTFEDRKRIWEEMHRNPPQVNDTPWSKVIARAVSAETFDRFESASALARALEEVTLRAAGDETAKPYPGLSAFQKEDARFFFGRELEVEEMWKKLRRPHLLAVIGPSGAGKSSFLRAGLLPTLTEGWQALLLTPGSRPFANLSQVLSESLGEGPRVAELLARCEDPGVAFELLSEWRQRSKHTLLIVDQFEELFTQNPEDIQQRFADLLGRLPLEADLHVLLSMRDDFLFHCHRFEALRPILSDLTLLGPPTGASLRRAIVEPALRCGYRFEDEAIVEAMLAEVEGERGALPLVAFTAAQLWERRDKETGYLTKKAYEQIGGVGGALAQHAEAMLAEIGEANVPIVRELFRNLVTAQGTRASRDREELLSVFSTPGAWSAGAEGLPPASSAEPVGNRAVAGYRDPEDANEVLDTLIDARLLTSYEVPADDRESSHQRIEIVHESLLEAWPRLVRWRTQDAEGAQLRDELRAQAALWDQHGRSEDYLWTGAAYLDYLAWRERYPGGLTTTEAAYARAMTAFAERRKRLRRVMAAAAFLVLLAVLGVVSGFWRRSVAEARRAEAAKLLAIAQLQLETDPTEALAYTTASLELADSEEARLFTMRLRWEGPPAVEFDGGDLGLQRPSFNPDGSRLAASGYSDKAWVWEAEGGAPVVLSDHKLAGENMIADWSSQELLMTAFNGGQVAHLWKFPGGQPVRTVEFGAPAFPLVGKTHLFAEVIEIEADTEHEIYNLRSWQLPNGEVEDLGRFDATELGHSNGWFDPDGSGWVYTKANEISYRPLPMSDDAPDRLVGSHENEARFVDRPIGPDRVWTSDVVTSELVLWDLSKPNTEPLRVIRRPVGLEAGKVLDLPDSSGRWISSTEKGIRLWDLQAWSDSRPLLHLRRTGTWFSPWSRFHPKGTWLASATHGYTRMTLWPLEGDWPMVVDDYSDFGPVRMRPLTFSPDSRWLATRWPDNSLRLWPLPGSGSEEVIRLPLPPLAAQLKWKDLVFDPRGRFLVLVSHTEAAFVVPVDGSPPKELGDFSQDVMYSDGAISPSGRLVAIAFRAGKKGSNKQTIRVWNLETGETKQFDLPEVSQPIAGAAWGVWDLVFTDESTLYTSGAGGVRRWDLETGTHELVVGARPDSLGTWTAFDPGAGAALVMEPMVGDDALGVAQTIDLATGAMQELPTLASIDLLSPKLWPRNAFAASGAVAAVGDPEGVIRVASLSGGEPHLLLGHEGPVDQLAISPDGRWIASTGEDNTLRLWPMPDLDKPPLHTLPREELIAKLKSLTNLRAVRDAESSSGWSIEVGPFPGWEEVPTW